MNPPDPQKRQKNNTQDSKPKQKKKSITHWIATISVSLLAFLEVILPIFHHWQIIETQQTENKTRLSTKDIKKNLGIVLTLLQEEHPEIIAISIYDSEMSFGASLRLYRYQQTIDSDTQRVHFKNYTLSSSQTQALRDLECILVSDKTDIINTLDKDFKGNTTVHFQSLDTILCPTLKLDKNNKVLKYNLNQIIAIAIPKNQNPKTIKKISQEAFPYTPSLSNVLKEIK